MSRWERLFADLDAEMAEAERAEWAGEVADRIRRDTARLRLVDRLRAALGLPVELTLSGGVPVAGTLSEVGRDWLLVVDEPGRDTLVPLASVLVVSGLGVRSVEPGSEGRVAERLDLGHALRRIARDRAPVVVVLSPELMLHGTLDRVGADFVEVAEHAVGEPRRRGTVRRVTCVPMTALHLVRAG